jgi:hypothetical protein
MLGIQTKYIAPTNTRGSRIKAWANKDIYVTIPYPYGDSEPMVYFRAVEALVKKYDLQWPIEDMTYGGTPDGMVFCFKDSKVSA